MVVVRNISTKRQYLEYVTCLYNVKRTSYTMQNMVTLQIFNHYLWYNDTVLVINTNILKQNFAISLEII